MEGLLITLDPVRSAQQLQQTHILADVSPGLVHPWEDETPVAQVGDSIYCLGCIPMR